MLQLPLDGRQPRRDRRARCHPEWSSGDVAFDQRRLVGWGVPITGDLPPGWGMVAHGHSAHNLL